MIESTGDEQPREGKKHRRRLKQLCSQIRELMEFYFSDANLHKDRFIKKLMDQSTDGYIDLEVFINFNKLKKLTTDMTLVAKALSSSDMLKINEEKTKVKRVTPVGDQKDVDDRTVYVECLPLSADHDWVKKIFSNCGKVDYVSLPKYRSTGDLKGFAFVEFSSTEEAHKACQQLNNPPATAPNKPGMFPKTRKQLDHLHHQMASASHEMESLEQPGKGKKGKRRRGSENAAESKEDGGRLSRRARKRQRSISEGSAEHDSDGSPVKRRVSDASVSDSELKDMRSDKRKRDKRKRNRNYETKVQPAGHSNTNAEQLTAQAEISDNGMEAPFKKTKVGTDVDAEKDPCTKNSKINQCLVDEATEEGEKSKRTSLAGSERECKEAKRVKISDEVQVQVAEADHKRRKKKKRMKKDAELPELRVISKAEWLELKAEYLKLQRASMSRLKSTLSEYRQANMAIHDEAHKKIPEKKKNMAPKFTPGVIIKVSAEKDIDRSQLKELLSPVGQVAYVDVLEGYNSGHLRCVDAESAAKILQANLQDYVFTLLSGDDEKLYWDKLAADREKKLSSRSKRRGRDKLLRQADTASNSMKQQQHVIFDED